MNEPAERPYAAFPERTWPYLTVFMAAVIGAAFGLMVPHWPSSLWPTLAGIAAGLLGLSEAAEAVVLTQSTARRINAPTTDGGPAPTAIQGLDPETVAVVSSALSRVASIALSLLILSLVSTAATDGLGLSSESADDPSVSAWVWRSAAGIGAGLTAYLLWHLRALIHAVRRRVQPDVGVAQ